MDVSFVVVKTKDNKYKVFETILAQETHDEILKSLSNDMPAISEFNDLEWVGKYISAIGKSEKEL